MKNIITWFSTYQEKMKKRTLRIHRNIEAARLRRARRKRGLAYTYCKNCGTKLKGSRNFMNAVARVRAVSLLVLMIRVSDLFSMSSCMGSSLPCENQKKMPRRHLQTMKIVHAYDIPLSHVHSLLSTNHPWLEKHTLFVSRYHRRSNRGTCFQSQRPSPSLRIAAYRHPAGSW